MIFDLVVTAIALGFGGYVVVALTRPDAPAVPAQPAHVAARIPVADVTLIDAFRIPPYMLASERRQA